MQNFNKFPAHYDGSDDTPPTPFGGAGAMRPVAFELTDATPSNDNKPGVFEGEHCGGLWVAKSQQELWELASKVDAPIVLNQPMSMADLEKHAILLGAGITQTRAFGDIRRIEYVPGQTHSLAESLAAHPWHTDGSFAAKPPKRFALYFDRTDPSGGGVSTFQPFKPMLEQMSGEFVVALTKGVVRYQRADDQASDSYVGHILEHDEMGTWFLRWRDDEFVSPEIVDDKGLPVQEGIKFIRDYLQNTPPLTYRAREHDYILCPNQSWAHGRTALSPASPRLVYRTWF